MGNETSSVKIHELLSAEDLKNLREKFPGAGNQNAQKLNWQPWTELWPPEFLGRLERLLLKKSESEVQIKPPPSPPPVITFHAYQNLAGNLVRGTTEERAKLIFALSNSKTDSKIKASVLLEVVTDSVTAAGKAIYAGNSNAKYDTEFEAAASRLAQSLIHDLVFSDSRKHCLNKSPSQDSDLSFDTVERWMAMTCPMFDSIFQFSLAKSFSLKLVPNKPLVPYEGLSLGCNSLLSVSEAIFLNQNLPMELRNKWRPLFNSTVHGESFSKLSSSILNQGPTLVIIWEEDKDGVNVFGGFAAESWKLGPKFYGSSSNFLFSLKPRDYVYESTSVCNKNFQYMNLNQKTLPNGLGFGGQLEYFGLWLDAEYGKARVAPTCSTYNCPQMSKDEYFHYSHLEIWGLGEEPARDSDDDDEEEMSVLNRDPEAQAVMEMMGKTFISKDIKAADAQIAKERDEQPK